MQKRQAGSRALIPQPGPQVPRPTASCTTGLCDPGGVRQHLCAPGSTPLAVSGNSTSSSQAGCEN